MIWWLVIVALSSTITFLFGIGVGIVWYGVGLNMHLKTHKIVIVGDNWGWQKGQNCNWEVENENAQDNRNS